MFRIMAKWKNGRVEEVDTAEDAKEAEYLVTEYRMAFGLAALSIWYEED